MSTHWPRTYWFSSYGGFFSHLLPGVVGLHPSSFHRRVRSLRRFLEPLRRLPERSFDPLFVFDAGYAPVRLQLELENPVADPPADRKAVSPDAPSVTRP